MNFDSLLNVLPEPWRQPSRLGMIASLGFHGLFFGVLPFLPGLRAEESERVIDLVQLSPAEQSRLPGGVTTPGSGSFFDVPTFELPNDLPPIGALPPLDELPSNFSAIPQIPQQLPPFDPAQRSQVAIQPFARPLPSIPTPQTVTPVPVPSPITPPEPLPSPDTLGNLPEPTLPNLESGTSLPDGAQPEDFQVGSDLEPLDEFARNGDQSPASQTSSRYPAEIQDWYARVQTRTQEAEPAPPKEQELPSLPYPQAACQGRYEGTAVVGVVVAPDGSLAESGGELGLSANPELLESSGYPILNQSAIAAVQGFSSYEATDSYQTYIYRVPYQYSEEDCAEAASPSPTPTPTPTSSTTPTPSPTPTTSAEPTSEPSPEAPAAETTPEPTPTETAAVPSEPEPAPSVAPAPAPEAPAAPEPQPSPSEPLLPPLEPFQSPPAAPQPED